MSPFSSRWGYHEPSSVNIPSQASLEKGGDVPGERKIMKLEENTVVWSDRVPGESTATVFKMYRNRGWINWQREKLFRFRVEREYRAVSFLAKHGILCSIPLFWTHGCHEDHGVYEILCMKEIPNAVPLQELASSGRNNEINYAELHGIVRRMHELGFYHGRLDMRNILTAPDETGKLRYYIIDTPQAILFPRGIVRTRMAWTDLRQLSFYTNNYMGKEQCKSFLAHYGLDEKAIARMILGLKRGSRPLLVRNLMRFEFRLRSRCSFTKKSLL